MFSDLATIRAAVRERLTPALPDSWDWEEYVTESPSKSLVPVVFLEFTGLESAPDGQPLGRGQAGARFQIIVADPGTSERAEDAVDEHMLRLIGVLEHSDDLYWSTGTKQRLPDGRMAWRVDVLALTETPQPQE